MKKFSQEEQEIIRRIVEGKGFARNFVNLIDNRNLGGVRVSVNRQTLAARILFEAIGGPPTEAQILAMAEQKKALIEQIILYVGLFRYLEKNDLAISYTPVQASGTDIEFGLGAVNLPFHEWKLEDTSIAGLIAEYYYKEIIPSHSLNVLVQSNFVTEEERRFRYQMMATWSAIAVSLIIGIAGIYVGLRGASEEAGKELKDLAAAYLDLQRSSLDASSAISSKLDQLIAQTKASASEIAKAVERPSKPVQK